MCLVLVSLEDRGRQAPPATWPEAEARLRQGLRDYDELHELGPGWSAVVLRTLAGAEILESRLGQMVDALRRPYTGSPDHQVQALVGIAIRHPQEDVAGFVGRAMTALDLQRDSPDVASLLG
jgi:hypothetical protein